MRDTQTTQVLQTVRGRAGFVQVLNDVPPTSPLQTVLQAGVSLQAIEFFVGGGTRLVEKLNQCQFTSDQS